MDPEENIFVIFNLFSRVVLLPETWRTKEKHSFTDEANPELLKRRLNAKPIHYELASSNVLKGFPCGSAGIDYACNAGDLGSIPGLKRSLRGGKGYPLQYSGLKNFMDYTVHGVLKSWTQLSDFD